MATLQTLIKGGGGNGGGGDVEGGGDAEVPLAATIKLKAGKAHEVMVEIDHRSVSVLRWTYEATVRESSRCSLQEQIHAHKHTNARLAEHAENPACSAPAWPSCRRTRGMQLAHTSHRCAT